MMIAQMLSFKIIALPTVMMIVDESRAVGVMGFIKWIKQVTLLIGAIVEWSFILQQHRKD